MGESHPLRKSDELEGRASREAIIKVMGFCDSWIRPSYLWRSYLWDAIPSVERGDMVGHEIIDSGVLAEMFRGMAQPKHEGDPKTA
jgi:hypothetical protein